MKKQILIAFALVLTLGFAGQSFAQIGAETIQKTKTKSNQSNDRISGVDKELRVVKIRGTSTGCEIVFNQAIVSPRDAASGLPTGKRMHKPYVITKEYDKSSPVLAKGGSGGGSGKVSMSDLSVTLTSKGKTQKLAVTNGEFLMPEDCDDDDCDMVISWSWGASNSGSPSRCEVPLKLTVVNGACMAIKQKGTGAAHN
ncbi:MAG: hypothetical protein JZU47_09215 [Prolixibacteraceae bacterium]|nr:hypothetical protein [Prolixibacteraceae bacterium]